MGIYVQESHTNESKGYHLCDPYEYETGCDTPGELFKRILKDGWRCMSSVYLDNPHRRIGWYFEKLDTYEDVNEKFKHGMWVTLLEGPSTTTVTHKYMELDANAN